MAAVREINGNDLRTFSGKLERWEEQAQEAGNAELAESLGLAYEAVNDAAMSYRRHQRQNGGKAAKA